MTIANGQIPDALNIIDAYELVFAQCGTNYINNLINYAGVQSKGNFQGFGEAYTDSNGRMNSVASTTGTFQTDRFIPIDTALTYDDYEDASINTSKNIITKTGDTGAITDNSSEAGGVLILNFSESTYSTGMAGLLLRFGSSLTTNGSLSATISAQSLDAASEYDIDFSIGLADSSNNFTSIFNIIHSARATAVTWHKIFLIGTTYYYLNGNGATATGTVPYSTNYFAIRIQGDSSGGAINSQCSISITTINSTADKTVTHTIPSGTFGTTISSAIGVPIVSDWDTGADIKYKLTNATEDTGWLTCGITPTISAFTAFTSEPTSLIVKLVPKSSSPTAGYPSIKGFWVHAWNGIF